jgi:hypothetical protein
MNEVLFVAKSARGVLHPLDFGVERFAGCVGDSVPKIRDDVFYTYDAHSKDREDENEEARRRA